MATKVLTSVHNKVMSSLPKSFFTVGDYLAMERVAETKHQFVDGEIFDMAGGSPRHALIPANFIAALKSRMTPNFRVFTSDLRVCVDRTRLITYPDLTVICGKLEYLDGTRDTVLNPKIVAEVLSPSTEDHDRGKKSYLYREVGSLDEYLLISQDVQAVELCRRLPGSRWEIIKYTDPHATIELVSLGIEIPMHEIYAGVDGIEPSN